ncbi:MAG: hypothetical protein OXF66_08530 [Gammaproteobacteria bacterium]|nr:hypothetical protein [Gammaproteobacteria bacterium]
MPDIQPLKPAELREAWHHEARDFTPWLVENIDRLGDTLDLKLEQVQAEVKLGHVGRVDICARQAGTDAKVVIENQLGESDDSHCLRLLGYAAGAEASILVWVARDFTAYHKGILNWLNEADTIDIYAVRVRAFRVGDALAADFETVVEPSISRNKLSHHTKKSWNTRYAEFYRPLVAQLRQSELLPMGKGGFRGRFRSFQTGCAGSCYAASWPKENPRVYLWLFGNGWQQRYEALRCHRKQIEDKVDGAISWEEEADGAWIRLEFGKPVSWSAPEAELEDVRQWMAASLLSLKDALQPKLDSLMEASNVMPEETEVAA